MPDTPRFPKAPPALVRRFDDALARTPGERRVLFGYPAGFVNGNLFCGVFGREVFVRLSSPEEPSIYRGPFKRRLAKRRLASDCAAAAGEVKRRASLGREEGAAAPVL